METTVALKLLKNDDETEEFLKEVDMLKKLNHVRCSKDPATKKNYIVTEFMNKGNVWDLVQQKGLTSAELLKMALDAAVGMIFLEKKNIIHRDLSLRNLLITGSGTDTIVKVGDFGLSLGNTSKGYVKTDNVTIPVRWTAPEGLRGKFSCKSDVWSFGIVLLELFSQGVIPYIGLSNKEVVELVDSGQRAEKPKACPAEVYELMLKCWTSNPEDRPTFSFIYEKLKEILSQMSPKNATDIQQNDFTTSPTYSVTLHYVK